MIRHIIVSHLLWVYVHINSLVTCVPFSHQLILY
jgi:hypothetical protein